MNYRHAYHAGNFADVLKHALMVGLIRALQKKEKGFVIVDTHAGRGSYDLGAAGQGETRERAPEWPDGIGRLWDGGEAPAEIRDYLELVRAFDRSRGNLTPGPRFYPGSPAIARQLARPQDRLELWEMHPAECGALRTAFGGLGRVAVHEADGYTALRACLPPPERRALVLIDPPFEAADEEARVRDALGEGIRRFPSGVLAIWYPVSERAGTERILQPLSEASVPALAVELMVDRDGPGLQGCGVLVANPPWGFDDQARTIAAYLEAKLGRPAPAQSRVRWLVSR